MGISFPEAIRSKRRLWAASLAVRVKDQDGNGIPDAYLLLVRDSDTTDGVPRWYDGNVADQYGEAQFSNLSPGRYRLYALDRFDLSLLDQVGGLQRFDAGAVTLDLEEGGSYRSEPEMMHFEP